MKQNYHQPLLPEKMYHIFSSAIGNDRLFKSDENYLYFLKKLMLHTGNVCEYYAYSLLPNHFHLLARIKTKQELIIEFEQIKKRNYNLNEDDISNFVSERFSNLLNAYTKAYNKMYFRKGALFIDFFKRTEAKNSDDFNAFIFYIHKNAIHHQYTKVIGEWKYDSYKSFLTDKPTSLLRDEVLRFFQSKERYIEFHQQAVYPKPIDFQDI